MNPLLSSLQAYPFERLRELLATVTANPAYTPVSLGLGEPRHATPTLIQRAMTDAITRTPSGLSAYPATAGEPGLRQAFADWLARRYQLQVNPLTQTLPILGSREALFSLTQTVVDRSTGRHGQKPLVVSPNPFYQIYEGSALLAGAEPYFVACDPTRNFAPAWDDVPTSVWSRTQLLFVCSPGNPTGAVMPLSEWQKLFALSDQHGFVIASDECYSEIYFGDQPPLGGLQAAALLGRHDFKNLMALTSLSKRSSVPGMRSGFVAGDASIIQQFLLYRTYHGSAMSPAVQVASLAAWSDETHVMQSRALYQDKFAQVMPLLADVLGVALPDAGFYLWAEVPGDDTAFTRALYAAYNVTVLPGSYLAREVDGHNPGRGRIRMALVAETAECVEAARRIRDFARSYQPG
ncbi:MAG: succinyldiaminopimelate transaminase [Rhodoferax sp.]|uniref:succinyldiaminopimelate transaminase n=1 Tax=Rhodoferax sp. TaxID=50421 RepID=UPI001B4B58AE|nr:succinyldiaminopimelate transaminase [Rhodoferax sp.]MBP9907096.1 succinyldiaminopimelate transaminase [Rhodoferax sp.]